MTDELKLYIDELNKQYKTGIAREHSYRPALKDLLQSLLPKMVVTNEPAHFECGAPDYIISREKDHLPIFFVEAKDVNDNDLDGRNKNAEIIGTGYEVNLSVVSNFLGSLQNRPRFPILQHHNPTFFICCKAMFRSSLASSYDGFA